MSYFIIALNPRTMAFANCFLSVENEKGCLLSSSDDEGAIDDLDMPRIARMKGKSGSSVLPTPETTFTSAKQLKTVPTSIPRPVIIVN
jgi:hypothetical protein